MAATSNLQGADQLMEIPLAALVDRVEETDTQLNLIGIVGLIRVDVVPTIVERDMKLFIRVRFDPSEAGKKHTIRIQGLDSRGTVFLMGTEEFRLPERDDAFQDITFNIKRLQFHRYGKHMIEVFLDEERKQVIQFLVEESSRGGA